MMGVEQLMNGLEENFIITKSRRGKCSKGNGALIGVSATFRPASRFLKLLHTPVIKASRDQLLMVFDLLTPEKKVSRSPFTYLETPLQSVIKDFFA